MRAQQNTHQFNLTSQTAISTWSDSLCGDVVMDFTYNNEPKQGGTEV